MGGPAHFGRSAAMYLSSMTWDVVIIVAVATCLVAMPFLGLYLRRRWLTGQGGLFDCAYRVSEGMPGSGWVLGFARYREDRLEWFRAFSLALRPSVSLTRSMTTYVQQRPASGLEQIVLFEDSRVILVRDRVSNREMSMAMDADTTMGLITWLESAPPGSHYIPAVADPPL